jgi:hypothetical protein
MFRDFKKDLEYAKKSELDYLAIVQRYDKEAYIVDGESKDRAKWDIISPRQNLTYEIKMDGYGEHSGNAFFELYTSKGYKLGILKTWASFYVMRYELDGAFYQARPQDIVLFLMTCGQVTKKEHSGDRDYIGVVVPIETYINQQFVIKIK